MTSTTDPGSSGGCTPESGSQSAFGPVSHYGNDALCDALMRVAPTEAKAREVATFFHDSIDEQIDPTRRRPA